MSTFTNGGKAVLISQNHLTDECLLVQAWGLGECESCRCRGSKETPHWNCGGKKIRKTGRNSKGYSVPLENQMG